MLIMAAAALLAGCKKDGSGSSGGKNDGPITGSASDAPIKLEPAWRPGNTYIMRLERAQNSQVPGLRGGGGTTNPAIETSYAQEYSLTITNGENGTRGAELEILGIELQVSRGEEQLINYDSQNKVVPRDPNNPMLAAFDKLVGGKVRYQFSADHKVLKVEGINDLFNRMEVPEGGDQAGRRRGGMGAGMLRQALNEEVFRQMVDVSGAPPNAVKIGETWPLHKDVNAPLVGKISIDITNTLRGWQERDGVKCARVEFTGALSSGGSTNAQRGPLGAQIAVKDGIVNGHYWYDPHMGITREMVSDQSYTISGTFPGGRGTNAQPRTISAPVRETTSVKLLEIKPAGQ